MQSTLQSSLVSQDGLLQLQPGVDAKYDQNNPPNADLVVVDKSSMIDLILANKLVKAVPQGRPPVARRRHGQAPLGRRPEVPRDLLAASGAIPGYA